MHGARRDPEIVIPGRANGANPESITTDGTMMERTEVVDFGFAAVWRPGMTCDGC
jgi:hypothetical protein